MRKIIVSLLMLLCLLLPAAALADTYTFAEQGASVSISDSKYTILTPGNIDQMTAWLEKNNKTAAEVKDDFASRGVLLQGWSADGDVCLEISAVQDVYAQQYHNVNQCTETERKNYRVSHSTDKSGEWRAQGYDYSDAAWKNYKKGGRFLQLTYTRTLNGQTYRGYARKTVNNGWHINVEYQVFDRSPKKSDANALEAIMTSWQFTESVARPATSATSLIFTSTPPAETNSGKFTLSGTGTSGLKVVGVVMRMSATDVYRFETEIDKKGAFELDIQLPREGLWMMTYTVFNGETVVEEGAFDSITYDDTLLSVKLNTKLPATMALTGSEFTISGTTMKQTKVQCIVDGRYNKQITTNNSGNFSFTIDTSEEGIYNITLVFEKKGYDARRFRCEAKREYTEEDRKQSIRDEAVKPSYKNLKDKITSYRGKYMVYTLNIKEVSETSTGYITFAGMSKTKAGVYKDLVVVRSTEQPDWSEGDKVRMYLKCLGAYELVDDSGTTEYPYFDLQFVE
ncbi:MAG: hypothetical protein IJA83_10080 [Clostridia bacterium]|nr:hypothetical protein [Clostridia bacterium]